MEGEDSEDSLYVIAVFSNPNPWMLSHFRLEYCSQIYT